MTKRFLAVAPAAGVVAGLGLVAFLAASSPVDADPLVAEVAPALPVAVRTPRAADGFDIDYAFTGEVRAARVAELGFELDGRVLAVRVDVGDVVSAGQELARLEEDGLRAERAESAARRDAAEARLAELEAGPRIERIDAARAEVERWSGEVELAELDVSRRRELVERGIDQPSELDRDATRLRTAEAQRRAAQARLAELERGTRSEELDRQRATVAQLRAAVERLDVRLADCVLRAPFAGRVAARSCDEGAVVAAGQVAVRLVEDARLEAWVGVPVDATAGIEDSLIIALDDEHVVQPAAVRVSPELDRATRTVSFVLELPPAAHEVVRPGDVVRVSSTRRVESPGYWLPLAALTESVRGLWSCWVARSVDGDRDGEYVVERAALEVLHVGADDQAFVRGTLDASDRVLVTGVQRVVAGQRVLPRTGEQ